MVELGKGQSFFAKALAGDFVGECARRQDFHGHIAVQSLILSEIDYTHPTLAELLDNTILP